MTKFLLILLLVNPAGEHVRDVREVPTPDICVKILENLQTVHTIELDGVEYGVEGGECGILTDQPLIQT